MSDTKELSYSDVSEHTSKKDLYVVIHDKVYNASSFVDEHPYVYASSLAYNGTSALESRGLFDIWITEMANDSLANH